MKNVIVIFAVLAITALVPLLPYLLFGYRGEDYLFHLHSWIGLRHAWMAGVFNPGWASGANYTLGDPRYLFYPPVSFFLGAGISLLLPLFLTPATFVWLSSLLAGLCMYVASRSFVRQKDRIRAAVLYMLSPYLLLTSISRFAVAELLVQAWLPLILLAFYKVVWRNERRAALYLSCLLGLSWLTNIPESIVLLYTFLLVAAIASLRQRSLRPLLTFVFTEVVAGCLAAFYLLPVLREQSLISPNALLYFNFHKWLIFARSSQPYQSLQLSCWLCACVSFLIVVTCLWTSRHQPKTDHTAEALFDLSLISFIFQLPFSFLFWEHLPKLSFVQFPFRFLPVLGVAYPLALLAKKTSRSLRISIYVLLVILAVRPFTHYWGTVFHSKTRHTVHLSPLTGADLRPEETAGGWEGTEEYIPAGAIKPASALDVPKIAVVQSQAGTHCTAVLQPGRPEHVFFIANSDSGCRVQLPLFAYPYWIARDSVGHQLPAASGDGGLMVVTVPAGEQKVELQFHAISPYRSFGRVISFLTAILLFLMLIFDRRRKMSVPG